MPGLHGQPPAAPATTSPPAAPPAYQSATLEIIPVSPSWTPLAFPAKAPATPGGPYDGWSMVTRRNTTSYTQVTWLGGKYIAVGNEGSVVVSADAISWKKYSIGVSEHLKDIAYDGKNFVAVGDHGTIATSTDLEKWTAPAGSGASTNRYYTIVWTGKQFVADGDGIQATSPDAVAWDYTSTAVSSLPYIHHALWTGNLIIAPTTKGILTSPDGATWTQIPNIKDKLYGVATDGKIILAVGEPAGVILTSADGKSWSRNKVSLSFAPSGVVWTGKAFLAAGGNGRMADSPDGLTWMEHDTKAPEAFNCIAEHNGVVIIGTATGEVYLNKILPKTEAPDISFTAGAPGTAPLIILTSGTPGAKIYYTVDGSDPTPAAKLYTVPFALAGDCIIRTRAYKEDTYPSNAAEAHYIPGTKGTVP